jgi:hypothetical protein
MIIIKSCIMSNSSNILPKIFNYNNLSFDKLEYFQPHKTNQNTQVSTVSYRLKPNLTLPIYIETPKLKTLSGVIKLENRFYIDLELDTNTFYDFITNLDEKNVMSCHYHSHEWFNQRIPLDVIEDYYKSPVRLQRGGKLPILRVRIPSHNGKILAEFYNNNRDNIDMSKVSAGDEVVCILEFVGLRFLSQQFIAEWSLSKLKLMRTTTDQTVIPSGYYFSDVVEPISTEEPVSSELNELLVPVQDEEQIIPEPPAPAPAPSSIESNSEHVLESAPEQKPVSYQILESEHEVKLAQDENEEQQEFNFNEYADDEILFEDSEYELDEISDDVEEVKFDIDTQVIQDQMQELDNKNKGSDQNELEQLEKQKKREEALHKMKEYEDLMIKQKEYLESLNLTS